MLTDVAHLFLGTIHGDGTELYLFAPTSNQDDLSSRACDLLNNIIATAAERQPGDYDSVLMVSRAIRSGCRTTPKNASFHQILHPINFGKTLMEICHHHEHETELLLNDCFFLTVLNPNRDISIAQLCEAHRNNGPLALRRDRILADISISALGSVSMERILNGTGALGTLIRVGLIFAADGRKSLLIRHSSHTDMIATFLHLSSEQNGTSYGVEEYSIGSFHGIGGFKMVRNVSLHHHYFSNNRSIP